MQPAFGMHFEIISTTGHRPNILFLDADILQESVTPKKEDQRLLTLNNLNP